MKFEKYSAWKEYIEKTFEAIIDNEDAYRFMVRRLRNKESYKEMKKYGKFSDNLLKFIQIEPKNKLKDNYDKYKRR